MRRPKFANSRHDEPPSGAVDILVADDDPHDQMLFAMANEDAEVDVKLSFVNDGLELLSKLESLAAQGSLPDLVVLDMRMPKCDGHEVLDALATNSAFDSLDVVVFSTSHRQSDIEQSVARGALWHEVKPSSYEDLVSFVETIARRCLEQSSTNSA